MYYIHSACIASGGMWSGMLEIGTLVSSSSTVFLLTWMTLRKLISFKENTNSVLHIKVGSNFNCLSIFLKALKISVIFYITSNCKSINLINI